MKEKEVTLQIRLPLHLRESFLLTAKQNDDTASRLLRAAIRRYVQSEGQTPLKL